MVSGRRFKILHLTTHLDVGGITRYIQMVGGAMIQREHEIAVASSGGGLTSDFRKVGFGCYELPVRTKSEVDPRLWVALPRLVKFLGEGSFDVMHAHTRVTQVLAAAASVLTRVPFVTTAHGFFKSRWGRRFFGCWGRRVIAVSAMVEEDLKKNHGVSESRIVLIPNAVDSNGLISQLRQIEPQSAREEFGIPRDALVVGSISRLVEDKGHAYLVEAAADLKKKHPRLYLFIIGDGRERERLNGLVIQHGLEKSARILPTAKDVTAVLSTMDIFVHPATFREGFGFSIAEAMIAQKPVVATNIRSVNALIQSGVNGLLVEPKSAPALAEAIGFLIENPEKARRIAENGHALALEYGRLDKMADAVEAVYADVVWRHGKIREE